MNTRSEDEKTGFYLSGYPEVWRGASWARATVPVNLQKNAGHFHTTSWPWKDIRSLQSFLALFNHPCNGPIHLHCSHDCNTIARLMRNIWPPPDPPCVCNTPYNIGSGNIVYRPNTEQALTNTDTQTQTHRHKSLVCF